MKTQLLESFDKSNEDRDRDDVYQAGFAAGRAEAEATFAHHQSVLKQEFIQAVKDLEFGFVEARAEVMRALAPLFQSICATVLPHMIARSYEAQIARALLDAAEHSVAKGIHLTVHPERLSLVKAVIGSVESPACVSADDGLAFNAIAVGNGASEALYDYDGLSTEISRILQNLGEPEGRAVNDG